jgi:hypothetical protein
MHGRAVGKVSEREGCAEIKMDHSAGMILVPSTFYIRKGHSSEIVLYQDWKRSKIFIHSPSREFLHEPASRVIVA